ncbi:MAG: hypothetical protein M3O15_04265 [Acidobacteriota bacterium]|nr:hypothetical protein [Acidobacteriota bacterium]
MAVAAVETVTSAVSVLPKQTINFSVPDPKATAQLSLPLYQGAGYRAEFRTWSLLQNGGFFKLNLRLSEAVPVDLTMSICAALVDGKANCPITITVNGHAFVNSYSDHNANFHNQSWTIPANLLHPGNNEVRITLDLSATTQLFINAITVEQAVLLPQTIDFSVPDPKATAQFSLPLYQGAGFRADFKTWSLLVNGGFFRFNLSLVQAIPVDLTFSLCAALVGGKANCPVSIRVNGAVLVAGFRDTNPTFQPFSWTIAQSMLRAGNNEIQLSLDMDASTQIFMNAATVSGG